MVNKTVKGPRITRIYTNGCGRDRHDRIREDLIDSWFIPRVLRLIGLTSVLIRIVVSEEMTTKINDHESLEFTRI